MRARGGIPAVDNRTARERTDQQLDLGGAKSVGALTVGSGETTRRATRRRCSDGRLVRYVPRWRSFNPDFPIKPGGEYCSADNWSDFHPGTRGVMIALTIPAVTNFTECGS
jgi:hypothetical protein